MKLTDDERSLLRDGLLHWGGPGKLSAGLASLFDVASVEALQREFDNLEAALFRGATLDRPQLRMAILATEIMFASDMIGAGVEWETVTGSSDADTLAVLRPLQIRYYSA